MGRDNTERKQAGEWAKTATCHHEAGHTICGLHNFFHVPSVQITNAHPFDSGETFYFQWDTADVSSSSLIHTFLIFDLQLTYAGLIAEKMYHRDITGSVRFPMHLRIGSAEDMAFIAKQIRKHHLAAPGEETRELKAQIAHDTAEIIHRYWLDVKLVAHRLYQKKRLSFDELKTLLTRHSTDREFWKDRFKKIALIHADTPPDEQEVRRLIR